RASNSDASAATAVLPTPTGPVITRTGTLSVITVIPPGELQMHAHRGVRLLLQEAKRLDHVIERQPMADERTDDEATLSEHVRSHLPVRSRRVSRYLRAAAARERADDGHLFPQEVVDRVGDREREGVKSQDQNLTVLAGGFQRHLHAGRRGRRLDDDVGATAARQLAHPLLQVLVPGV